MRMATKRQVEVAYVLVIALLMAGLTSGCAQPTPAPTIPPPTDTPKPETSGYEEIEVEWAAADGDMEGGVIYVPEGSRINVPVVLFLLMRGPRVGQSYDGIGRELARHGYASVMTKTRSGAEGYEDALTSLAWLRNEGHEYGLDRENIAVFGHLSGAIMALRMSCSKDIEEDLANCPYTMPDNWRPQALITYAGWLTAPAEFDWPGICDAIMTYTELDRDGFTQAWNELKLLPVHEWDDGVDLGSKAQTLAQWMPYYGIDGSEPPSLLIGIGQGPVPVDSVDWMAEQLTLAGAETTSVVYEMATEGSLQNEENPGFDEIAETVINFLDRIMVVRDAT